MAQYKITVDCQTHFMRNILDATPKSLKVEIRQHVRAILDALSPAFFRFGVSQHLPACCWVKRWPNTATRCLKPCGFQRRVLTIQRRCFACRTNTAKVCVRPTPSNDSMRRTGAGKESSGTSRIGIRCYDWLAP